MFDYRDLSYMEHLILKEINKALVRKTRELITVLEEKESQLTGVDKLTLSKLHEMMLTFEDAKAKFEKELNEMITGSEIENLIVKHFGDQIGSLVDTALENAKTSGEFDGASITITNIVESDKDGGYNIVTFSDGSTLKIRNGKGGSGGGEVEKNYFTVISNLTNVTSSSDVTEVEENSNFWTYLTTAGTMESVVVTMGGEDITATVYDAETGKINIPAVTGHIVITASAVLDVTKIYYSITHNLTDVTASSNVNQVEEGKSYTVTLTPTENYTMKSVVVRMGGTDITSTVYTSGTGTISIPSVTGDVTITASAEYVVKKYTISYNLDSHTLVKKDIREINEGEPLEITFVFQDGYQLDLATFTMDGEDINNYFNSETLTLSIPAVTGDVVITVQEKEVEVIVTTDCADAITTYGIYSGHVDPNTGAESPMGGETSTNHIMVKNGDILYMNGVNPFGMYGTTIYFVYFDTNKTRIGSESVNAAPNRFTINCEGVAWVRITQLASLTNAKITVNIPIT